MSSSASSPNNQSLEQIIASTISGLSELQYWLRTLPPTLKADFDATIEIRMLKMSRAMAASS